MNDEMFTDSIFGLFYPSRNNRRYSMSAIKEAVKNWNKTHPDINHKHLKGEVHSFSVKANCPRTSQ
jgi:hypothetical protein